jgi:hypothetical protein
MYIAYGFFTTGSFNSYAFIIYPSGKIYSPGDPSSGLKESILFLEIVYFLILGDE